MVTPLWLVQGSEGGEFYASEMRWAEGERKRPTAISNPLLSSTVNVSAHPAIQ